jgi:hypothetical protein
MKKVAVAHANEISYELHTLGWKAFQDLCSTICSEVWGQTVQSFLPTHDGGRDGAFAGQWDAKSGEILTGSFTVQCKFASKPGKTISVSQLAEEIEKARRLAERGLATNYILMTNADLTATADAELKRIFESIPGVKHFSSYGRQWICRVIRESQRLRMLVPRVYGLGDLSQILDERAYKQAREILSALGDDLAKFVITDAYRRSAKALVEHGLVLLLGEPASGKSTIAAALSVGAADNWGSSTVKVLDADDFVRHWNPDEPRQFFWIDDAFGATQVDWSAAAAWNRAFTHVNAAIRKGARVVFTSRDYIYKSARQYLKEGALPLLTESQVVIHVEDLSKDEKEQILYNHIRLGTQPTKFKAELKPYLATIAGHERFLPEIARRLGNPLFTKKLILAEPELRDFVERPLELLREVIRTADTQCRAALALVFMRGGSLPSPIKVTGEENAAIQMLGGNLAGIRESLNSLNESLVLQVVKDCGYAWKFKHPTVRDAFGSLIAEDRELLGIYMAGTPIDKLLGEISCGGNMGYGIKISVPQDLYEIALKRLSELDTNKREEGDALKRFLAFRCGKSFLAAFLEKYPQFIPSLHIWSHMDCVAESGVIGTLNREGLVPEPERLRIIADIAELAIDTPDAYFLANEDLRGMFTGQELADLCHRVKTKLLPKLEDTIWEWRSNCDRKEQASSYFDSLITELNRYQEEFSDDRTAVSQIDAALKQIESTISELESDGGDDERTSLSSFTHSTRPSLSSGRSVFDDVDE